MKKVFKSRILLVIVTVILTGSISVYAAGRYYATQVDYEPSNPNFNVDNMADALDELYDKAYTKINNLNSQIEELKSKELEFSSSIHNAFKGNITSSNKVYSNIEKGEYIVMASSTIAYGSDQLIPSTEYNYNANINCSSTCKIEKISGYTNAISSTNRWNNIYNTSYMNSALYYVKTSTSNVLTLYGSGGNDSVAPEIIDLQVIKVKY